MSKIIPFTNLRGSVVPTQASGKANIIEFSKATSKKFHLAIKTPDGFVIKGPARRFSELGKLVPSSEAYFFGYKIKLDISDELRKMRFFALDAEAYEKLSDSVAGLKQLFKQSLRIEFTRNGMPVFSMKA